MFLGVNLLMRICGYPQRNLYWSYKCGTHLPIIADSMPEKRFWQIQKYLHFNENEKMPKTDSPDYDKLYKVRPILNSLQNSYLNLFPMIESLSIDEVMIPFKGKHSLKQYIRNKPIKRGYKVWVLAGINGYVYRFIIYEGKSGKPFNSLGLGEEVVMKLCTGLENHNHKVYFDNFFTSFKLVNELKNKNIFALGTIKQNRLPKSLVLKGNKEMTSRGDYDYKTDQKTNITIVKWQDNSIVQLISSFSGIEPVSKINRYDKKLKTVIQIDYPNIVKLYNKHMGGVDKMDMLLTLYINFCK